MLSRLQCSPQLTVHSPAAKSNSRVRVQAAVGHGSSFQLSLCSFLRDIYATFNFLTASKSVSLKKDISFTFFFSKDSFSIEKEI